MTLLILKNSSLPPEFYCQAQFQLASSAKPSRTEFSLKSDYFYPHPPTNPPGIVVIKLKTINLASQPQLVFQESLMQNFPNCSNSICKLQNCQAQPQLNSTSTQTKAEVSLNSTFSSQPPEKVDYVKLFSHF